MYRIRTPIGGEDVVDTYVSSAMCLSHFDECIWPTCRRIIECALLYDRVYGLNKEQLDRDF